MATILTKRGLASSLENLTLEYGEMALAFSDDYKKVSLYAGASDGEIVLINPDAAADVTQALTDAKDYTDGQINNLVNGAPEAMDTLAELAAAIAANSDIMTALQSAIGGKVDKVTGKQLSTEDYTTEEKDKLAGLSNYTHPSSHAASIIAQDSTHRFVTDTEKSTWNSKLSASSTIDGGTF